jgi:hypothetical protein
MVIFFFKTTGKYNVDQNQNSISDNIRSPFVSSIFVINVSISSIRDAWLVIKLFILAVIEPFFVQGEKYDSI